MPIHGYHQFNKGNIDGQGPPDYPLDNIPAYECEFVSPRNVGPGYRPLTAAPDIGDEDLNEVKRVTRKIREGNAWPIAYANRWQLGNGPTDIFIDHGYADAASLADLVSMDRPTDLWRIVTQWLDANGHQRKTTYPYTPFLEHDVAHYDQATSLITRTLEVAFDEKYYHGQARPEELTSPDMPLYECPSHPSYPAGHGSVAGATVAVLEDQWTLDPTTAALVELTARQFAHSRTFAGVHFGEDNEVGYNLGRYLGDIAHGID